MVTHPHARKLHSQTLSLSACESTSDVEALVVRVLHDAGGIRWPGRIAKEVAENLRRLKGGFWKDIQNAWARLAAGGDRMMEREVARMIDRGLKGFGPKQARNLLQGLGLATYEVPLDSRFARWFEQMGFGVSIPDSMFLKAGTSELILDSVQELCRRCDIIPCALDAAIYCSFDEKGDGWNGRKSIW